MKLRNPFKPETRELFHDVQYWCFNPDCKCVQDPLMVCDQRCNGGTCGGTELNHTWGRISRSPFNGSVLCKGCHAVVGHTFKEHEKLFMVTMEYLFKHCDYTITEEDEMFFKMIEKDLLRMDLSTVYSLPSEKCATV